MEVAVGLRLSATGLDPMSAIVVGDGERVAVSRPDACQEPRLRNADAIDGRFS